MTAHFQSSRNLLAVAALALCFTETVAAEPVSLSSLDLGQMTAGWSDPKVDQSVIQNPIRIGGEKFERGVGTHANSRFRVDLGGNATRFVAKVGITDENSTKGSVEFIVWADLKEVWRSKTVRHGNAPVPVDIDLTGVQKLTLIVNDAGDGSSDDHAVWADAAIVMKPGSPDPVALSPHDSIRVASRDFSLDFTIGDDGRVYQSPVGGGTADQGRRIHEAYPQWGDGYIYEPALQITHADGNTSTSLLFQKSSRLEEAEGRVLHKIHLRDPAYRLDVALCFRVHEALDVIEQWTEISHRQNGEIKLERMASSSLNLQPSDVRLTQFQGDWALEMQLFSEVLVI